MKFFFSFCSVIFILILKLPIRTRGYVDHVTHGDINSMLINLDFIYQVYNHYLTKKRALKLNAERA